MDMILYNTLMGFCAGLILLITASLFKTYHTKKSFYPAGYGAALLILGIPLTVLSGAMALTWPLNVNPAINIAFAEPCLMLGILAAVAGAVLMKAGGSNPLGRIVLRPTVLIVFALGLMLATISSAIFSYNLVGDAPPMEPITGQFKGWENTAFGLVYLLAAIGCLALPWAKSGLLKLNWIGHTVYWAWTISGILFLLFSILNYRTHIGLILNVETGTNYKW